MFFSLSHTCGKMKNIFLYFFTKLKLTIFIFCLPNMTLLTLLILKVCRAHVIHGLCSGSCSPQSIGAQNLNVWGVIDLMGTQNFFSFVPCSWQNKEHLSRTKVLCHLFKPQHQCPHSLYSSLYLLFGIDKKNMCNSCKVVIIFFILMVLINDFAGIKYREIRCWSLLGLKELRELYM